MIHVLGAGNIGSLFALSLARKFPVEFLLKPSSYRAYLDTCKSTVQINVPQVGGAVFEAPIPAQAISYKENLHNSFTIEKLVVAVKAHDVLPALLSVQRHIRPSTEVLILHNGMGVWEQIESSWPDVLPRLAFGVTDAGVKRHSPLWKFDYTGHGICKVAVAPIPDQQPIQLLQNLVDTPELVVTEEVDWEAFEQQQQRKLVVNSVINPLTTLVQCENGALSLVDDHHLMYRLVAEGCRVLELDEDELFSVVLDVVERTASNVSSMLADVENGRESEIEYINGYIVREARRKDMGAPLNRMLRDLVSMRVKQLQREADRAVPLV